MSDALQRLAAELRSEGGILAATVVDSAEFSYTAATRPGNRDAAVVSQSARGGAGTPEA